jgi:hypothetical protein
VPMSAVSEHSPHRQAMLVTLACRDCCMCWYCVRTQLAMLGLLDMGRLADGTPLGA